jgi:Flp pilus assembly protein TadG
MRRITSKSRISRAEHRGSVTVELALMLPLLAIFVLGATDLGFIVREHQVLQNAAREGARFSAQPANNIDTLNPTATANAIRDKVINYLAEERIIIASTDCTPDGTVAKQWNCGAITIWQQHPISTVYPPPPAVGGVIITDFGSSVVVTYDRSLLFSGGSLFQFNSVSLNGKAVFRNLY